MPHVTGDTRQILIINIFGRKRPLYRIDETYEHMGIENLFSRGISLEDLTDYNLARTLGKSKSSLDKAIKAKVKEAYACSPDAEAASAQLIKEQTSEHFVITGRVVA